MATKKIDTQAEELMNENESETTALAPVQPAGEIGVLDVGEINLDSLPLPRLQITYGVGKLSENYNPGDMVLGGENFLVKKKEPLEFIVYKMNPFFKEYMNSEKFNEMIANGGSMQTYKTRNEVLAAGGTLDWVGQEGPTFQAAVELHLLVRKPKDLICGMFGIPLPDGHDYAPAIFTLDKQAYKKTGEAMVSTCIYSLQGKLLQGLFELTTDTKPMGKLTGIVPAIKLMATRNTQETQDAIKALFG